MRIAIFADIHGNLIALESVLSAIDRDRPDQMECLGDVAAFGPQPHAVLERLREVNCPVVMGNTDEWLLNPQPASASDEDGQRILEIDLWCADQLSPSDRNYLRTFQPTIEFKLGDAITLLCCHGSPRSNTDVIRSTSTGEQLDEVLTGVAASIIAGGHTHRPMIRRHRNTILINCGSVGLPYEFGPQPDQVSNPPWAEYALVDCDQAHVAIELRRAPVDVSRVIQSALNSGMPHAEWWTKDWTTTSSTLPQTVVREAFQLPFQPEV